MNKRGIVSVVSLFVMIVAMAFPASVSAQTDVEKCLAVFDDALAQMSGANSDAQMTQLSDNVDKMLEAYSGSEQVLTKDDIKALNGRVRKMFDGMLKVSLRIYGITDPTMIGVADEEMQKKVKLILNQVNGSKTLGEYVTKLNKAIS